MRYFTPLLIAGLGAGLAAQSARTIYSPNHSQNQEGVSCSSHLFIASTSATPRQGRYQQIHTDTKGAATTIGSMTHRRDTQCASGKLTLLEIEIIMAHATASASGSTFSKNYKGTPTTVLKKKKVNPPDWSSAPTQAPGAWAFRIPFDAPFSYNGTDDLLWEQLKHGATSTGNANIWSDYEFDLSTRRGVWGWLKLGTGCTATGRTAPMNHTSLARSEIVSNNQRFNVWVSVNGAPSNAASALIIGTIDPNGAVPGLCANVRAAGGLVLPATASTSGIFGTTNGQLVAPYVAAAVGSNLYTQGASLDQGRRDPIKVSVSNGLKHTVGQLSSGTTKMVRTIQFSSLNDANAFHAKDTGVIAVKFN